MGRATSSMRSVATSRGSEYFKDYSDMPEIMVRKSIYALVHLVPSGPNISGSLYGIQLSNLLSVIVACRDGLPNLEQS